MQVRDKARPRVRVEVVMWRWSYGVCCVGCLFHQSLFVLLGGFIVGIGVRMK